MTRLVLSLVVLAFAGTLLLVGCETKEPSPAPGAGTPPSSSPNPAPTTPPITPKEDQKK